METVPSEPTTEGEINTPYADIIATAEEAASSMEFSTVYTLLYDIDSNGIEELMLMFPSTEDGKNTYACSLYTMTPPRLPPPLLCWKTTPYTMILPAAPMVL